MKTNYELKVEVAKSVRNFWQIAQTKFGFNNDIPRVDYSLRGVIGGQARGSSQIRVNMAFLKTNTEDYLKNVIGHELAHNIVHVLFGDNVRPHGKEWKRVMVKMGLAPQRCHSYSLQGIVPVHLYKCSCKVWELTNKRHMNVQKGLHYRCPRCKVRLVKC